MKGKWGKASKIKVGKMKRILLAGSEFFFSIVLQKDCRLLAAALLSCKMGVSVVEMKCFAIHVLIFVPLIL